MVGTGSGRAIFTLALLCLLFQSHAQDFSDRDLRWLTGNRFTYEVFEKSYNEIPKISGLAHKSVKQRKRSNRLFIIGGSLVAVATAVALVGSHTTSEEWPDSFGAAIIVSYAGSITVYTGSIFRLHALARRNRMLKMIRRRHDL